MPDSPMSQAAAEAQQKAAHLGDVAGGQLKSQLTSQKDKFASQLESISGVLDDMTQQLRQQQQTAIADYPETAAQQLRGLSRQLEQADLDQLLTSARRVARDRPGLFLGGAFVVGVLGARLMKGSSSGSQSAADSYRPYAENGPYAQSSPYAQGSSYGQGSSYAEASPYTDGATRREPGSSQMPGSGLGQSDLGRTAR
jgi:hypothetical protein